MVIRFSHRHRPRTGTLPFPTVKKSVGVHVIFIGMTFFTLLVLA